MPAVHVQIAQLPRLAHLSLASCNYSAASMAPLTQLSSSLTRLDMEFLPFPATLSSLTGLQHLYLWDCKLDEAAEQHSVIDAINDTLPHFQQLTCLVSACQADTCNRRRTSRCFCYHLPVSFVPRRRFCVTSHPRAPQQWAGCPVCSDAT